MNIGFFNPYFDGLGGGERYTLMLASHWSKKHTVDIFWDDETILDKAENRFGIDLSNVHCTKNIFSSGNIVQKLVKTRLYDVLFFLTDGSIPLSFAKYNILHIQVPFQHLNIPFYKKSQFSAIVCNSKFTKDNIDKSLAFKSCVIYPPVAIEKFMPGRKSKIILSVGRFSAGYQAKKQEILISAFAQGIKSGALKGYSLVLAGGLLDSDRTYYESLRDLARGLPVTFFANSSFKDLQHLYSNSAIYWHAAGFGETNPEYMEHFGISTVEGMRAGCVPVVYFGGGQPEIVEEGQNGYLFITKEELVAKTEKLVNNDVLRKKLAKNARIKALEFSTNRFNKEFDMVLESL